MAITLAFDVYGTLVDTSGVVAELEKHIGAQAREFSRIWRQKQLEYSFRRGLMRRYEDFTRCIRDALHYTSSVLRAPLGETEEKHVLEAYQALPAFPDVKDGLARAQASGFRMFAFSNGRADTVKMLLAGAGISDFFIDVVSVDEVKTFKPDPDVYAHFLSRSGAAAADTWLVSCNPFDVIGAVSSGMRAVWVRRSEDAPFDPWGIEATVTLGSLYSLADSIRHQARLA